MAEHKPDIFMKVTFADGREYVCLFDAKYRIDEDKADRDLVPVDALAQMHRYRDAIIYRHDNDRFSRPVYGAYALYPGYFDRQSEGENPYHEAIDKIDIGAFPFLPGVENKWLEDFLAERLGVAFKSEDGSTIENGRVADEAPEHAYKPLMTSSNHLSKLKSANILPRNHQLP